MFVAVTYRGYRVVWAGDRLHLHDPEDAWGVHEGGPEPLKPAVFGPAPWNAALEWVDARAEEGPEGIWPPMRCSECGQRELGEYLAEVRARLLLHVMCLRCDHWRERAGWLVAGHNPDGNAVLVAGGRFYTVCPDARDRGFKGFGGRPWVVTWPDGRVVRTRNLWCGGVVPSLWRGRLPDTAVLGDLVSGSSTAREGGGA